MAIATAEGVVSTEDILSDERVVDMQNQFRLLDVDESQFMTILNKLPSQVAIREKVNWLEDQYFPNLSSLAASATSAATTVTVATGEGDYFRAGDLVRLASTGEIMEVVSEASDVLTVNRSVGSVAANTAQTGVQLLIVGNAAEQGAAIGTIKVTTRVLGYNYTQIVRHPLGFTGTQEEIETYGPGDPGNEIAKKLVEHKRALENLIFSGARAYTSNSGSSLANPKGWMGGVEEFISTNVSSSVGALSLTALDNALEDIFQYGTMNKVIFAAPTPAGALSRLLTNSWVRARPEDKVFGAKVTAFINGAYGASVPVITKREWGRESTSSRGGWIVVLDLAYIKKRPLRNRGTRLLRNRQARDVDSTSHEYMTEMSLEFAQEKAHGMLEGITG
jgi:hypothetical protein